MPTKIITVNGRPNSADLKEYICDHADDVAKLPRYGIRGSLDDAIDKTINKPCAIGSTALVCDNGDGSSAVYILNASNEWAEL